MALEVTGILHKKFPIEARGANGFQTREFVLEMTDGNNQYKQLIKFQLVQQHCSILDSFNDNEEIKVHFDLRGREWNQKYLTNLNCWRIDRVSADAKPVAPTTKQATAPATATQTTHTHHAPLPQTPPPSSRPPLPTVADAPNDGDDDLPF
jgi:single-strand DNA-binding protein